MGHEDEGAAAGAVAAAALGAAAADPAAGHGSEPAGRRWSSVRAEPDAVVDLTDATLARHGGPAVDLTAGASSTAAAAPAVAPAVAPAALTAPSLGVLAMLTGSPLALLLLVNVLNVLDAALTGLWIELGVAVEANPIVDAIGFPAKIVAVGLGSYIVYRVRPRWLLVPIVALAAVCVYHVLGAAVVLGVPS